METKELTDKATLILDKMLDAVNLGIDKAPEFIGDLAREYVVYYTLENIFGVIAGAVCLLVAGVIYKNTEIASQDDRFDNILWVPSAIAIMLFGIFGLIFFLNGVQDIIQAIYAPKAFLIENIRK